MSFPFIPTTREEMNFKGYKELDILFVMGDAYIDHPTFGIPLLARVLEKEGFRVGIIPQPDWKNPQSVTVMGAPKLFCGVSESQTIYSL
jgi:hypothetical protein